jgi:hypothetical protein
MSCFHRQSNPSKEAESIGLLFVARRVQHLIPPFIVRHAVLQFECTNTLTYLDVKSIISVSVTHRILSRGI